MDYKLPERRSLQNILCERLNITRFDMQTYHLQAIETMAPLCHQQKAYHDLRRPPTHLPKESLPTAAPEEKDLIHLTKNAVADPIL